MNEWISVKDRLPSASEEVLIYVRFKCKKKFNIIASNRNGAVPKKPPTYGFSSFNEHVELAEVTHWMPLPQPPKE